MPYEKVPVCLTLPEDVYNSAMALFAEYGPPFEEAIGRDARLAYTIFGSCVREVLVKDAIFESDVLATVASAVAPHTGERTFQDALEAALEVVPDLGDDAREVVFNVIKNPTFKQTLLKSRKKSVAKTVETVLCFKVEELDHRLRKSGY